jgi:hypothetical protein
MDRKEVLKVLCHYDTHLCGLCLQPLDDPDKVLEIYVWELYSEIAPGANGGKMKMRVHMDCLDEQSNH